MSYTLNYRGRRLSGEITLAGSKSISNRALIIRALSGADFPIHRLANARDTDLLLQLLQSSNEVRDAGAAGTTFRFMTAFLAGQPGVQLLTGTERMKQRPIGILVDALRWLGADIRYLEKEGYPPLRIGASLNFGQNSSLSIAAGTSSQYISALLLIAPTLPGGLSLHLEGKIVSRPYIEMTLGLMQDFGVQHSWEGDTVHIPPQPYRPHPFQVEADWSAASYYYAMAAFADEVDKAIQEIKKSPAAERVKTEAVNVREKVEASDVGNKARAGVASGLQALSEQLAKLAERFTPAEKPVSEEETAE